MSDSMESGSNKVVPLGSGQESSNSSLGVEGRVEGGTNGSRPDMSHSKYGGDKNDGKLFVGSSEGSPSKESNSQSGGQKSSAAGGYYGPTSGVDTGTVGSREQMGKLGGGSNKGKLFGEGASGNKNSSPEVVKKVEPGLDVVKGTSDSDKNLARSLKGIGGKGNKRA